MKNYSWLALYSATGGFALNLIVNAPNTLSLVGASLIFVGSAISAWVTYTTISNSATVGKTIDKVG